MSSPGPIRSSHGHQKMPVWEMTVSLSIVAPGLVTLLAATSLIDLRRYQAAGAYLTTAMAMAGEAHYRYDPAKAEAYVATTLSWLGDPAAVDIARSVLATMENPAGPRPRRAVAARTDLALALSGAGRPDEAAGITLEAVTSPYLVPSSRWRADEVIAAVEPSDPAGSAVLREAITARRHALPGKTGAPLRS